MSAITLFTSTAFAAAPATTQPAPRDISDVVKIVAAKHNVPGMVGAIVDLDGVAAIGAAGVRKAGSLEPFTVNDVIHLGSDTKAMTATLVGQLIEQGQLKYQTTLAEAFPQLAPRMDADFAMATVEQLLNHRAGLPAQVDWWKYERADGSITEKRLRIVNDVLQAKSGSPPGSKYSYSNVGYLILGAIVEAKTHQPWESAIGSRLFDPLHMTTAGFGPPGTPGQIDQPWGHVLRNGQLLPSQIDNAPPLGPAGRVHCTMSDWAKFIAWTLREEHADSPILSSTAHTRLITPLVGSEYAGGWILTRRPWAGGRVLTHEGSNTMWVCVAWLAPKRDFAVLAATNVGGDDANKACDDLSAALIGAHNQKP